MKNSTYLIVTQDGVFRGAVPGRVIGRLSVDVRWSWLLRAVVGGLLGSLVVSMFGIKRDAVCFCREQQMEEDFRGLVFWYEKGNFNFISEGFSSFIANNKQLVFLREFSVSRLKWFTLLIYILCILIRRSFLFCCVRAWCENRFKITLRFFSCLLWATRCSCREHSLVILH